MRPSESETRRLIGLCVVCSFAAWLAIRFGDRLPGGHLNLLPEPCESFDFEGYGGAASEIEP
jgi:hypothetical protein